MIKIGKDYKNIAQKYNLILESKFSKLGNMPSLNVTPAIIFQFGTKKPLDDTMDYKGDVLKDLLNPEFVIASIGLVSLNLNEVKYGLFNKDPGRPDWQKPLVKQNNYVKTSNPTDFDKFYEELKKGKTLVYYITFHGSNRGYIFNKDGSKLVHFLEQVKASTGLDIETKMPKVNRFEDIRRWED